MSLFEDLADLRATKPRTFDQWLEVADVETKTAVLGAIADEHIPANQLAVLLTQKHGIPITRETILRRRGAM